MEINVSLHGSTAIFSLSKLEEITARARVLAKEEVPHNSQIEALLKDPSVRERRINVDLAFSTAQKAKYRIVDSAIDEEGYIVTLGTKEYFG